ncbi:MAG TPA: endolytic transglycosylase MltG [Firmicutes bacterium]|nr:endolytic transglycosylase MltG [Bacillota bacterium]
MPESLQVNLKRTWLILVRFVFLLLFLGNLAFGVLMTVGNRPMSVDPDSPSKVIRISQGMSASQIILLLDEEGIIANPSLFRLVVTVEGAEQSLQAGSYLLNPQMTPVEIIEHLRFGRVYSVQVVIPEGFEIKQIAAMLADKGLADPERFIALASDFRFVYGDNPPIELPIYSLEGYLYPDTYFFHEGQTEEELIVQMMGRFIEVTNEAIVPLLADSDFSLHEVTTLGSIIEREIMVAQERPIVASVYLNRLAIGMPLQADPTVRYVTAEERPQVLYRDLEIDSPYNTYLNHGLPPGPIGSPGLDSMLAVLNPAETDYLFFVSRRDGTHEFTKTYNEHLAARRLFGY